MIAANPLLGTALHGVGALSAAVCYTPQKGIRRWSWQTFWWAQAAFCWFLLPILGAVLTIPNLGKVLAASPRDAMLKSFVLGVAYGVGGTAFNIAIRYIGFSLTYAIAVGLSSVLGTLIPPLVHGTLGETFGKAGAGYVFAGIVVGTLGIAMCGVAGRLKEVDLENRQATGEFSLSKGLLLSLLAGVLSAIYGLSLDAGKPIAEVAETYGAGEFKGNVIYIFSNTGAFVTTSAYCLYLGLKHRTLGEFMALPAGKERASLGANFFLALLTGLLWYGQFFFYNLGNVRMGTFEFTSWAIHMIMLVLFSTSAAMAMREWSGVRRLTQGAIAAALVVLVGAILLLTCGNYLGSLKPAVATAPATQATAAMVHASGRIQ
jgi:L-rhamnose-H+ transport protein